MPRTTKEESADLSIKLINPGTPFYAGSVIIGHVIRKSPITTPFATIRVRLKARAKVRLAVHFQDSGDNIFRSQFNFWPENAVAETLHEGELQVPSSLGEADSWPFALTIPTHTNAKGLNTGLDNDARKACFLNLPEDKEGKLGVPEQPLPGTFYTEHTGSERSFQSFVEFWIEAELKMRPTREAQTVQAKLPVTVLFAPSPSPPITNFARMRRIAAGCVSTQRLFPGMENAKLSFMQRSKKYFGSTKIPVLRFSLDVIYPTVIQLGNPAIIPFALRFNPIKDRSSDVIQDMPRIYLESTALEIHSTTEVVVPFRRKPIYDDKTRKTCVGKTPKHTYDVTAIELPTTQDEDAFDMGAWLELRIDENGLIKGVGELPPGRQERIYPTHTTYSIKHHHALRAKINLLIAGEIWTFKFLEKVTILPPIEQVKSGPEGSTAGFEDAPPPYSAAEVDASAVASALAGIASELFD